MQLGPRSFVAAYNTLVADSLRMYLSALPDTLSTYQAMRQAAVTGDYQSLKLILTLLGEDKTDTPPVPHALNNASRLLLNRNELDLAEAVFRLYLKFFPQSENPYLGLGALYVLKGDYDQAADAYRDLLAVAPTSIAALEMLDLLGGTAKGPAEAPQ